MSQPPLQQHKSRLPTITTINHDKWSRVGSAVFVMCPSCNTENTLSQERCTTHTPLLDCAVCDFKDWVYLQGHLL